jgi:hypothetical protein
LAAEGVEGFGVSPTTASVSCTGVAGVVVAGLLVVDARGVCAAAGTGTAFCRVA